MAAVISYAPTRVPGVNAIGGSVSRRAFAKDCYFTVTATCAVDQQHWNPPPPAPVESFASTRRVESPGALNVALVDALPSCAVSMGGLAASNFTSPGPRNFVQVMAIRGGGVNSPPAPRAAPAPAAPAPRPRPRPCAA